MTKWAGFALRSRRHHITNLDGTVGHNHPINQELDQLAPLRAIQFVQGRRNALAERAQPIRQANQVQVLLGLRVQLPQLGLQPLLGLAEILPLPRTFVPPNHLGQLDRQQAGLLAFQLRQRLVQRLALRLERLWQPRSCLGAQQFVRQQRRLAEHLTEILPDQVV